MNDRQKTPRGHPDFHSYVKILTCFHIPDIFLVNTLLLYSLSPYRQTELQMEKQMHSLCVSWRNLFSSFAVVSVFCSGRKQFLVLHTTDILRVPYSCDVTYSMYLEYHTVVVLCQFLGSGGKQVLVLCTYLVYNTVVRLCQFFCCGGKANLVQFFLLNPIFFLVHRNRYLEGMDDRQKTPRGHPDFHSYVKI